MTAAVVPEVPAIPAETMKWLGPALIIAAGCVVLYILYRAKSEEPAPTAKE